MAVPASIKLKGITASAGYATGRAFLADSRETLEYTAKEDFPAEVFALQAAIEKASKSTQHLLSQLDEEASDILEFQLAMLEDDTFFETASSSIRAGETANRAWTKALNAEIAGYESSDDEYFRARSADITDIRDRVLAELLGRQEKVIPPGAIYVGNDISPSVFLSHNWTMGGGLALRHGSVSSHVSMLARSRGVPAIVNIGNVPIIEGSEVLVDGKLSLIIVNPDTDSVARFKHSRQQYDADQRLASSFAAEPALTKDNEQIQVLVNIADPSDTDSIPIEHVDGVGLFRTEFLFHSGLPNEETQYQAYRKVVHWAQGKPVTIRTVDAGGDKPIEGFTQPETNSFLGMRGIRLSLRHPDIFRVQIRALLRAASGSSLKVMLPMISIPEELEQTIELFDAEAVALQAAGIEHAMPDIGVMVEVPSVAVLPDQFNRAAFLSIGSNDLIQYVLAVSRDNSALSAHGKITNPAVLALIENVVQAGIRSKIDVSICGDAASDTATLPFLLNAGIRTLSVSASQIGAIKSALRDWSSNASSNNEHTN